MSGCPDEMLLADDLALVSSRLAGLKWTLETWKEALQSKRLWLNVTKTKMMISGKNR